MRFYYGLMVECAVVLIRYFLAPCVNFSPRDGGQYGF